MAKHNELGAIGEKIAAEYLVEHGMEIIDRNYTRTWGEIDIVARETEGLLVFVEVKSVSYETGKGGRGGVPYETRRPEENIHPQKLRRLSRTIETYLMSKRYEGEWRFDVMAVFVDQSKRTAYVRHTKDVIIGA
jgi:putative endonuclease